jgi:hypothetical protein
VIILKNELKSIKDDLFEKYFPDEYISHGMKAAVDYMLAKSKDECVTQAEICNQYNVCEVTLRNNMKKIFSRIKKVNGDNG